MVAGNPNPMEGRGYGQQPAGNDPGIAVSYYMINPVSFFATFVKILTWWSNQKWLFLVRNIIKYLTLHCFKYNYS